MKFNYCIAHYWEQDSGRIGTYAYGNDVFFGDIIDATEFLEYVKTQSNRDWRIFQIVEIPTK